MQRTLAALKVYDAGKAARCAMWENARTNEDVDAAEKADKEAALTVQTAFHLDTKVNSFENCKLVAVEYIRYAATGRPSPGSVNIGNVMFGKLTGGLDTDGKPKWTLMCYMGKPRVDLLQAALDGRPLPAGLILVGKVGSGIVEIPSDAVCWASSGLKPSREVTHV